MRIPGWLHRISQPEALSSPAWLLMAVPSLMWGTTYLGTRVAMPFALSLLWGIAASAAMGLTWFVARITWMRAGSAAIRAALIIPTLALAAFARSAVIVVAAGPVNGPSPIPFGVITMTVLSVGAILLVDSFRELKVQNGRLAEIRDALEESDTKARLESESLRSSARQVVRAALENALEAERSGAGAAIRLRQVSDDVVRPLSHNLSRLDEEEDSAVTPTPRRDLPALGRAILASGPVRPLLAAGLSVAMTFNVIAVVYGGPLALLAAILFSTIIALVLLPLRYVPWSRLPVGRGLALLVLGFATSGFLASLVMREVPDSKDRIDQGPLLVSLVVVLSGSFVAIMRGLLWQQQEVEEDLITEGRRLVEVSRATQARIRRDRRHLAKVLHGVVQPRIVARSIRLQAAGEVIDVEELVDELDSLLSQGSSPDAAVDLGRSLQDVARVWSGSAEMTVEMGADVERALDGLDATARAVVDIACEAVNNAVLRGGARRVSLRIFLGDAMVTVVVTNAAALVPTGRTSSSTSGLGSRVFDDLADHWSLTSKDGETVFTATISLPRRPMPMSSELPAV